MTGSAGKTALRTLAALGGVASLTLILRGLAVNATSVGFAYLLFVLVAAAGSGFVEALVASLAATVAFNYFFMPPVGTLTIADPQNWVALFSFLVTAVIGSRLSHTARRRAMDALERQRDLERLYTFSRAILLIDDAGPFAKQLAQKLADTFGLSAVVLYDRRSDEVFRAGPEEFDALDEQLREAALNGTSFSDAERERTITAVRLGSQPIASLGLQGARMPDAVLQGIGNLVAIGLERARAQALGREIEVARQSEQLRTTLIDAMAHELKTPLTSIRAATSALLAEPDQGAASRTELLKVADEEADHLKQLIDDSIELARLDSSRIEVHREQVDLGRLLAEAAAALRADANHQRIEIRSDVNLPRIRIDRRLLKAACKQLLDNALKYSPANAPVTVRIARDGEAVQIEITDRGPGITAAEQGRIFERFYRGPAVKERIPGSGLGLSIARSIARAHDGDLAVSSRPGETTFRLTLPVEGEHQ